MSLEPLFKALQAALPSSVRVGDALRVPQPGGSVRVIVPRSPWDPQVDHGLLVAFAPALDETISIDACHLRTRCRRSVDAIEAALSYGTGKDVEQSAAFLAVESTRQISEMWGPFLRPEAWVGPSVESLLTHSANATPADADPLLAMVRAAAFALLDQRTEARGWLEQAAKAVDPRVRHAVGAVRARLLDA